MAAWRYEISIFSTLEEKFHTSARPCNILYVHVVLFIVDSALSLSS